MVWAALEAAAVAARLRPRGERAHVRNDRLPDLGQLLQTDGSLEDLHGKQAARMRLGRGYRNSLFLRCIRSRLVCATRDGVARSFVLDQQMRSTNLRHLRCK